MNLGPWTIDNKQLLSQPHLAGVPSVEGPTLLDLVARVDSKGTVEMFDGSRHT
jgi:hypothetical protein